eukprot:4123883-Pleurochrysis_carterae.AAC.1
MASTAPPAGQVHKLTNVEAQRIMAILEESYNKLELIAQVPALRLPNIDLLSDSLGEDVVHLLKEQVLLEQQYEQVSMPKADHAVEDDGNLPDFETLDDELRHSTRVLCRMLREAPQIAARLRDAMLLEGFDGQASETMQVSRQAHRSYAYNTELLAFSCSVLEVALLAGMCLLFLCRFRALFHEVCGVYFLNAVCSVFSTPSVS